jgi:hypothetical protein
LYSGSEDDVHAFGTHDHFSTASEGCSLVFHVVDSIVSNGYEINVVFLVALADEIMLDGFVDTLVFVLRFKTYKSWRGDVALNTDRVDLTGNLVGLNAILFDSDNDKVIISIHHSQHNAEIFSGLGGSIEANSKTVLFVFLVISEDRILDNDQRSRAVRG